MKVKALDLLKITFVREDVSGCENEVIGNTLQGNDTKNAQGISALFTARRIQVLALPLEFEQRHAATDRTRIERKQAYSVWTP